MLAGTKVTGLIKAGTERLARSFFEVFLRATGVHT